MEQQEEQPQQEVVVSGGQGQNPIVQGEVQWTTSSRSSHASRPPPPPPPPPPPVYPVTIQAMKKHKDHPLRMKLERGEMHRAREIKDTIQRIAGLDNISDFWCAQYALVCFGTEGNVMMENVIERAETLQGFRNQYEIAESYQEGCRAFRRFVNLCPRYILAFTYDPRKGNYVWAMNPANMNAEIFSRGDVRDFAVGMYYIHLAMGPDLQSIHKSPSFRVECKSMGWSKRHNMKLLHKVLSDGLFCLPFSTCSAKHYNTGLGGAVFSTMAKAAIKMCIEPLGGEDWIGHAQNRIEFGGGLTYSEGLDSVFLVPDAATAQERALHNLEESLRLRFENERRFSLGKKSADICPITDEMVEAIYNARR